MKLTIDTPTGIKELYAPLLEEFINKKLALFVEPDRRGLSKGMEIGFSREKYTASLLRLTNLNMKEIANKSGVAHSSLRIWEMHKNEEDREFRAEIYKHLDDFVEDFLLKRIEQEAYRVGDELKKSYDAYESEGYKGLRYPADDKPLDSIFSRYSGRGFVDEIVKEMLCYSGLLQARALRAFDELTRKDDKVMSMLGMFIIGRFLREVEPKKKSLMREYLRKQISMAMISKVKSKIATTLGKEGKDIIEALEEIRLSLFREAGTTLGKIKSMRK